MLTKHCVCGSEIPYNKRAPDSVTAGWTADVVIPEAYKIRKIFLDTVGVCYGTDPTTEETESRGNEECGVGRVEWTSFPALDEDPTKRYCILSLQERHAFLRISFQGISYPVVLPSYSRRRR